MNDSNQKIILEKLAQKRSLRDRFRQNFDIGSHAQAFFDPSFKEFRKKLMTADNEARELGSNLLDFKRNSEGSFRDKNYLFCAFQVGRYYDTLDQIVEKLMSPFSDFAIREKELLIDHLDPEVRQELIRRMKGAQTQSDPIIKKAFFDWLRNMVSTRRKAVSNLEKRFNKFDDLRNGLSLALKQLDRVNDQVMVSFKTLSEALSVGDSATYEKNVKSLRLLASTNHKQFNEFFKKTVAPFQAYLEKELDVEAPKDNVVSTEPAPTGSTAPATTNPATPATTTNPAAESNSQPSSSSPAPTWVTAPVSNWGAARPGDQLSLFNRPAPSAAPQPTSPAVSTNIQEDIKNELEGTIPPVPPVTAPVFSAVTNLSKATPGAKPAPKPSAPKPPPLPKKEKPAPIKAKPAPIKAKPAPTPGIPSASPEVSASIKLDFLTKLAFAKNKQEMIHGILSYSELMEDQDPNMSMKLLAIAEGLADE